MVAHQHEQGYMVVGMVAMRACEGAVAPALVPMAVRTMPRDTHKQMHDGIPPV